MVNSTPEVMLKLTVTPEAAAKLKEALAAQTREDLALRVYVKPGGCSGFSYGMGLDASKPGDQHMDVDGLKVVVDPFSAQYLDGAEVGFKNELMGGGFTISNTQAASSCGCGTSFRPKDEEGHGHEHGHEHAHEHAQKRSGGCGGGGGGCGCSH